MKLNAWSSRFENGRALSLALSFPYLITIVIFILHDPFRDFILTPDADLPWSYEGVRFNSGLLQTNNDHTGYSYAILLGWWYAALNTIGILPISSLTNLLQVAPEVGTNDPSKIDNFLNLYATLVFAGRWLSLVVAMAFIFAFYSVIRLFQGRIVSLLITTVISTSPGLINQSLILRTELLSSLGAIFAFYGLIRASRSSPNWSPLWMFLVGISVMVSVEAKMQSVIYIASFPLLILLFGSKTHSDHVGMGRDITLLWSLTSLALMILPALMIASAIKHPLSQFGVNSGSYQIAILVIIIAGIIAFGIIYAVPLSNTLVNGSLLFLGLSIGLLFHLINNNLSSFDLLVNFVEQMGRFSGSYGQDGSLLNILLSILANIKITIIQTFFPTDVLNLTNSAVSWFCLTGILIYLVQKDYRTALQVAAILSLAIFMVVIFTLRGRQLYYHIYFEPWTLIAFAILIPKSIMNWRWFSPAVALGMILLIGANLTAISSRSIYLPQETHSACDRFVEPKLVHSFNKFCKTG